MEPAMITTRWASPNLANIVHTDGQRFVRSSHRFANRYPKSLQIISHSLFAMFVSIVILIRNTSNILDWLDLCWDSWNITEHIWKIGSRCMEDIWRVCCRYLRKWNSYHYTNTEATHRQTNKSHVFDSEAVFLWACIDFWLDLLTSDAVTATSKSYRGLEPWPAHFNKSSAVVADARHRDFLTDRWRGVSDRMSPSNIDQGLFHDSW